MIKGNRFGNTFILDFPDNEEDLEFDALDCETVSLEAAGLVERENDTVCGAQQTYYEDEA